MRNYEKNGGSGSLAKCGVNEAGGWVLALQAGVEC